MIGAPTTRSAILAEVAGLATGSAGRWLGALAVLVAALVAGWFARRWLMGRLHALAAKTPSPLDELVLEATRGLWIPGFLLLGTTVASRVAPLSPELREVLHRVTLSGFLAVLVLGVSRLAAGWLRPRTAAAPGGRPSLLQTAVRLGILVAGTLLVLDNLGIEVTSLLTALGIGSLAVGLALQPTLSNFFAGIHLSMSQPLRVGDFVELEDGTQGHVVDIGWRATRIRQLANNLVVLPNARLAEMRLTNYSLPEPPQAVLVDVGVAYAEDLERTERVTVQTARDVQRSLPEADPDHEPFIRYKSFGDSAIQFTVILRATAYTDRWPLIHEFIKRLHARYRSEGIEIPFPQRVVHQVGGKS